MSNNILTNKQFSFCDKVSTESAIFKLIESIFSARNNKEYIMGLFCDLTKAFDSVSHELLILKLEFYEVKGSVLNWLKSYLHNRLQRVVLQFVTSPNLLSDLEVVGHGVPQRSVLHPLPFNVYINDFPCIINKVSHTILFADDTNILVSSSNLNELNSKLNSVLHCISKWFEIKQLALDLNKTHIVKFATSKLLTYPLNIVYNNQALTVSENITFLGMHLNCNLTWKSHTDNFIKQLILICCMLRKLLPIVNVKCYTWFILHISVHRSVMAQFSGVHLHQ